MFEFPFPGSLISTLLAHANKLVLDGQIDRLEKEREEMEMHMAGLKRDLAQVPTPTPPSSRVQGKSSVNLPQMPPFRGGMCMEVDSRKRPFAPELPPRRT